MWDGSDETQDQMCWESHKEDFTFIVMWLLILKKQTQADAAELKKRSKNWKEIAKLPLEYAGIDKK